VSHWEQSGSAVVGMAVVGTTRFRHVFVVRSASMVTLSAVSNDPRRDFMPRKIVDISARSRFIREEPWHLHFWESTPEEALAYLRDPRPELRNIGIELPDDCRIETVITNHDWMAAETRGLTAESGPIVICNVGGGDVAVSFYRVTMYAHRHEDVGRFAKNLLHPPDEESVQPS
jgi:hypothetical protein